MSYASYEGRFESNDPEVILLLQKTVQEFIEAHGVKPVYVSVSGLPVSDHEAEAELFLVRNLPVGGSHLDILDGDKQLLAVIGLGEHLAGILAQPGQYLPTNQRRLAPLLTVSDLARCGAQTLMQGWPRLRRDRETGRDDLAEIIACLEHYANNHSAELAKQRPDLVTT